MNKKDFAKLRKAGEQAWIKIAKALDTAYATQYQIEEIFRILDKLETKGEK